VLTDEQITAIIAFLNTLTGNYNGHPVVARPKTAAPKTTGSGTPP